jgi:hypothetical protein
MLPMMWQVLLNSGQTVTFQGAERYEIGDEVIHFLDENEEEVAFFWRGYVIGVYPADAVLKPDKPMPIEAAPGGDVAEADAGTPEAEDNEEA